jgi:hypothetical protein
MMPCSLLVGIVVGVLGSAIGANITQQNSARELGKEVP